MKFIEFSKSLNSEIHMLYNAKGADSFLIKQSVNNLKNKLIKDFEEFNFVRIDSSTTKIEEIDSILSTLPFASDYRLIVIDSPTAEVVKLINKLDLQDTGNIILCVNAEKLENAVEIDCETLEKEDIRKYVLNQLAKHGISIHENALDYIIEACGNKIEKIANELQKIISYAIEDKVITIEHATNLISDSAEYVIYMLTNAIDLNDYAKYEQVLHNLGQSQSMNEIFSYLGKHFRRMQYLSLNKNDNEISKILNLKPYAIKISRQHIQKNGIKYYINLYQKYIELDNKIKSGKISAKNALYELVF